MKSYSKLPLPVQDQIDLLRDRGLIIDDESIAEQALLNYSYYRLSGYWYVMLADKSQHIFKPKASFAHALSIYHFDAELRSIVFKAIEPIEVALRTKLSYYFSVSNNDPLWYEKGVYFSPSFKHSDFLKNLDKEVGRSKLEFIKHHKSTYGAHTRLPSWKALEVLSLGSLSILFQGLDPKHACTHSIVQDFGHSKHKILRGWIHSLVDLRNMCAHHNRIWNNRYMIVPIMLHKTRHTWLNTMPASSDFNKIYPILCCIAYLQNALKTDTDFKQQLKAVFIKYPIIDKAAMGFTAGWDSEPLWI